MKTFFSKQNIFLWNLITHADHFRKLFFVILPVLGQTLLIKQIDICMILYNLQGSIVFIVDSFFV